MQTKAVMVGSAITMLASGILLIFAPQKILATHDAVPRWELVLLVQVTGALYLGFAAVNWIAKDNLIGGIYSRPVAVGNFLHFAIVAITLFRLFAAGHYHPAFLILTTLYAIFAAWFGLVVFRSLHKR